VSAAGNAVVDLVAAAYEVEAPQQDWLDGLLAAVRRWLPETAGAFAAAFDVKRLDQPQILGVAMNSIPPETLSRALALVEGDGDGVAFFRSVHNGPAIGSVRTAFGSGFQQSRLCRELLSPLGLADVHYINAIDVDGFSCTLGIPVHSGHSGALARSAWLERVQVHLAAAYRLRRHLASSRCDDGDIDAILDPEGRVHHATRSADPPSRRAALRAAAVAVERARGPLGRADPGQALSLWRAMVAGEWTLVDRFERDGRRFLVARRNRPQIRGARPSAPPSSATVPGEAATPAPFDLSRREEEVVALAALGYSNKLTAYALGMSPSTVATHMKHAGTKLGARTRAEIIGGWLAHVRGERANRDASTNDDGRR
jgi:DNA-binding CsgD family transcriptional regulator